VCIPSWQGGTIAKEGRLALIKSVISARPLQQLLIADAPVWLLYEVNKWARAFFWARKEEVNDGYCLVAWDNICKPTCFGGLGVDDLKLHGLASCIRWEWLRRSGVNSGSRGWLSGTLHPLVLQLVNTRNRNRRTVEVALQDNNWLLDISEPMSQEAAIQSLHLWIRVSNLPRNPLSEDKFVWPWSSDGQYSASSATGYCRREPPSLMRLKQFGTMAHL
jgi:hypothetical protein